MRWRRSTPGASVILTSGVRLDGLRLDIGTAALLLTTECGTWSIEREHVAAMFIDYADADAGMAAAETEPEESTG